MALSFPSGAGQSGYTNSVAASTTQTITYPAGGGALVYVLVSSNAGTVTGVTLSDGTNSYSSLVPFKNAAPSIGLASFYAKSVAAGAVTLTATFVGASCDSGGSGIWIVPVAGLDTTLAAQDNQFFSGYFSTLTTDAMVTPNLTPAAQPAYIIAILNNETNGGVTNLIGTGFTQGPTPANGTWGYSCVPGLQYLLVSSLTPTSAKWTIGAGGWFDAQASLFTQAGGGGGGGQSLMYYTRKQFYPV